MCMLTNFWSIPIFLRNKWSRDLFIHSPTFGPRSNYSKTHFWSSRRVEGEPKVGWHAHGSRDYLLQISELDQKLYTRVCISNQFLCRSTSFGSVCEKVHCPHRMGAPKLPDEIGFWLVGEVNFFRLIISWPWICLIINGFSVESGSILIFRFRRKIFGCEWACTIFGVHSISVFTA